MERQSVDRGSLQMPLGLAALLLAACTTAPTSPPTAANSCAPFAAAPACAPCPVCTVEQKKPPAAPLKAANWSDLPGWTEDDTAIAFAAFNAGCNAIARQVRWRAVCAAAKSLGEPDSAGARAFFEARMQPFQVVNPDASTQGMVTGYYEPLLNGSRERKPPYLYPVYATPDDLLVIDLASVEPQLKGLRLRGRVAGNRVVPYLSRAEIERPDSSLQARELLYVDDPVDLFFLQIQGSGRIRLDTGETVRLGYAEQNGHPYQSIGRHLVEQGELKLEQASMQGIKAWGLAHPERLQDLLNRNPSYVFFRESRHQGDGPLGALGVPLTPVRSIAVDPRVIPLGAPVFLSTTLPDSTEPLNRLMVAQDTGGAIRGAVRADFFWGFGPDAGRLAGKMRQRGAMWVLLPHDDAPGNEPPEVKL
jgi:membrane-bound lytic murein transglycosylase A